MLLYWYPERRRASELALPVAVLSVLFLPVELVYLDAFRSYRFGQAVPEGADLARYVSPPFNSLYFEDDEWAAARLVRRLVEDPSTATMDLVLERPRKLERVRLFLRRTVLGDAMPEWRVPEIRIFHAPPEF